MPKLVFVVGAGASAEFGLPTGAKLTENIAQAVRIKKNTFGPEFSDGRFRRICNTLGMTAVEQSKLIDAASLIHRSMGAAYSIDNFIDTHRDDPSVALMAKLAIASCILAAERQSTLFVPGDNFYNEIKLDNLKGTWLLELFKRLSMQRDFSSFLRKLEEITFISFNYDRCIHQFFWFASRTYFNLKDEDEARLVQAIKVHYPYGTVGKLKFDAGSRTGFGADSEGFIAYAADSGLRTFTEGCSSDFPEIADSAFKNAERIYFLGFGFLPLNMKMLFGESRYQVEGVFCTGRSLPATSIEEIRLELSGHFYRKMYPDGVAAELNSLLIRDFTCADLIWEHSRYFEKLN